MIFPFLQQKIKASFTGRSGTSSFYATGLLCQAGSRRCHVRSHSFPPTRSEAPVTDTGLGGTASPCSLWGHTGTHRPRAGNRHCESPSGKALLGAAPAGRSWESGSLSWSHWRALRDWWVACNFGHSTAALGTSGKKSKPKHLTRKIPSLRICILKRLLI